MYTKRSAPEGLLNSWSLIFNGCMHPFSQTAIRKYILKKYPFSFFIKELKHDACIISTKGTMLFLLFWLQLLTVLFLGEKLSIFCQHLFNKKKKVCIYFRFIFNLKRVWKRVCIYICIYEYLSISLSLSLCPYVTNYALHM